jgi:putative transposase
MSGAGCTETGTSRSKWEGRDLIVPLDPTTKYRRKVMFGEIRKFLGPVFHELARQKECRITALSDLVIYIDTAKTLEEQGLMPFQVYFMKMESAVLKGI